MSGISMSVMTRSKRLPDVERRERLRRRSDRDDLAAGGLDQRRQHVAEEGRIVDQQHGRAQPIGRSIAAAEPIGKGLRQEMADVDDLGGVALDHRVAEHAGAFARHFDVEPILDDIDDLIDHEAHGAAAIGEHQDRLRAIPLEVGLRVDAQKRHELIAVLHQVSAVGNLDLAAIDFLEPGDQRQRHRLGLMRTGAEHQERDHIVARTPPRARRSSGLSSRVACAARPSICATPFGSTIMITEPSPRIVVPENAAMWRSFDDIGLMTISSVWNTPSTTMPKIWLPTWVDDDEAVFTHRFRRAAARP